jgi:Ca2+-transporting ATPase
MRFSALQEAKAESAIAALKKITVTKIRVIRDGIEQEIEKSSWSRATCVLSRRVSKIPLTPHLEGMNLEINESVLTENRFRCEKKRMRRCFRDHRIQGKRYFEVT